MKRRNFMKWVGGTFAALGVAGLIRAKESQTSFGCRKEKNEMRLLGGNIWFVNPYKTTSGDGKTWKTAFGPDVDVLTKCTAGAEDVIYVIPNAFTIVRSLK